MHSQGNPGPRQPWGTDIPALSRGFILNQKIQVCTKQHFPTHVLMGINKRWRWRGFSGTRSPREKSHKKTGPGHRTPLGRSRTGANLKPGSSSSHRLQPNTHLDAKTRLTCFPSSDLRQLVWDKRQGLWPGGIFLSVCDWKSLIQKSTTKGDQPRMAACP